MSSRHPAPILGVIGGSGLYDMKGLENVGWREVRSPFGDASDQLLFGNLDGQQMVFLPRHGRGHHLSPSTINYRANIDAMKRAGQPISFLSPRSAHSGKILHPVHLSSWTSSSIAPSPGIKAFLGLVWSHTSRWHSRPTLALADGASMPVIAKESRSFEAVRISLWRVHNFLPLRNPTSTAVGVAMLSA